MSTATHHPHGTPERRPISFVATQDPQNAEAFYSDILGLTLLEASPYALVYQDGDITLRVQIVTQFTAAAHTVHGWQVTAIEREINALGSQGVKVLRFDHLEQDVLGIWTTLHGHKIAWFKDPCGNILPFTEYRPAQ